MFLRGLFGNSLLSGIVNKREMAHANKQLNNGGNLKRHRRLLARKRRLLDETSAIAREQKAYTFLHKPNTFEHKAFTR